LQATGILRFLTNAEKVTYGNDATIYLEVRAVDIFLQNSAAAAINAVSGSLDIQITDIADFAVTASKLWTKIPVIENLTLTNNSPSAGLVAWTACSLYYNGVKYSIAAGNSHLTTNIFIYWKDLASTFSLSATHPASLSDWKSGEDFIIATCTSGVGQEAWNAIANQVIGSAFIMNAAIQDAHVASLSGTKINASTSVSIGSTTYGNDGIQLEYNTGNPRFYAGNGSDKYVKFDGTDVDIHGKVTIGSGSSGYSNLSDKPTDETILNSYNLNPGNMAAFPSFEGLTTPGIVNFGYCGGWQFSTTHPSLPVTYGMNLNSAWTCNGIKTPYIEEFAPYGGSEGSEYSLLVSPYVIPVTEGKNYCFSVYTGAHRCQVIAYVAFYNSAQNYIGSTSFSSNNNAYSGGQLLSGYYRHVSYGIAPVGTVFAKLIITKYQTKVGADPVSSFMFACRPMFSEIGLNQTTAPPWSAGGTDNSGWTDTNGLITAAALGETIITGGYIKTSLLTADNIQTGTLQAARIAALGTSNLDSTVIYGGRINTNLLTADNIQAGTLVADRIGVGSLIYNKITASDGSRLIPTGNSSVAAQQIASNWVYTNPGYQALGGSDSVLVAASCEFAMHEADANGIGYVQIYKYINGGYIGAVEALEFQLGIGGRWYPCRLSFIDVPGYGEGSLITYQLACAVGAQYNYPYVRNMKLGYAIFRR